jgi:hypothetical protein
MYSRDISRKVKSAKRQRAYHGMFLTSYRPYGYKADPENKNRLVIDGEPAKVVKLIFRLFLEGKSRNEIAAALTARKIDKPSFYKTAQGLKGMAYRQQGKNAEWSYTWLQSTVGNILRNRIYAGDMVNHKYEVLNYKTKRVTRVPENEYIVVENTHEAIIARDDFMRVQQLLKAIHRPRFTAADNNFLGKVFCANCGTPLAMGRQMIKSVGHTTVRKGYLRCGKRERHPELCRRYNYIYLDDLTEQVSASLRKVIALLNDDAAIFEYVQRKSAKHTDRQKTLAEKGKLEKRSDTLTALIVKIYEDCITGVLDDANYQKLLSGYQQEQRTLNERLAAIDGELGKADDDGENLRKLKACAAAYVDFKELTAEMLNLLIERIEVAPPISLGYRKFRQEVSIIYRFINTSL